MNGLPPTLRYRWLAGEGDDYPDCVALDGMTRPLGVWQNSRMPGFHHRCRAVLQPFEEADADPDGVYPQWREPPLRLLHYRLRNGCIVSADGGALPMARQRVRRS